MRERVSRSMAVGIASTLAVPQWYRATATSPFTPAPSSLVQSYSVPAAAAASTTTATATATVTATATAAAAAAALFHVGTVALFSLSHLLALVLVTSSGCIVSPVYAALRRNDDLNLVDNV